MDGVEEEVGAIFRRSHALGVFLFGSHAEGRAHGASDVDVCLVAGPHERDRVSREALALTSARHDVKVFEELPLWLQGEILEHGRLVTARDERALFDVLWPVRRAWEDERARARPSPEEIDRILAARGHA